jgi:uncharacterized protein
MSHERQRILNDAREAVLAALPDVMAIYAYGSFARSEEWPQSDLDLAVLLPPERSVPDLLSSIAEVSMRTGRSVDLVELRRVGDVLRREVLEDGLVLYVAQPDAVLEWEASALTRYGHYRDEVRDIMEDFRRTGVGYGA